MGDTVRALAFRPGPNGFFDERRRFRPWVRLVHDAGSSRGEHGLETGKLPGWNIPGGEVKNLEWPLHITAQREGEEEGIPETFYPVPRANPERIKFENSLSGRPDDPRTDMGKWTSWTSSHQIVPFLFVEDNSIVISRDPTNPDIKPFNVFEIKDEKEVLECDQVGWWHVDFLPPEEGVDKLYYKARVLLRGVLAAIEERPELIKYFI